MSRLARDGLAHAVEVDQDVVGAAERQVVEEVVLAELRADEAGGAGGVQPGAGGGRGGAQVGVEVAVTDPVEGVVVPRNGLVGWL